MHAAKKMDVSAAAKDWFFEARSRRRSLSKPEEQMARDAVDALRSLFDKSKEANREIVAKLQERQELKDEFQKVEG